MSFRIRYSLKLLLSTMLVACVALGILASKNSKLRTQYHSLQEQGVLLDTELDLGFWPRVAASYFPAAFVKPKIAWIHFRDSGQYIHIGDQKFLKNDVESIFDRIIAESKTAGFDDIRFSSIYQTSGANLNSSFDIYKLYPGVGDGKYWLMPENQYPILMATNRETLGVDR